MSTRAPIQTAQVQKPEGRVSFEQWLAWAPESRITEWVDGEIVEAPPITGKHDAIFRFLIAALGIFLESRPLGRVRATTSILKLLQTPRGREPDLMFIAAENVDRIHPTYVEGPANAIWEIISPETETRDRVEKFAEYEAEGVPEYWLIDPNRKTIELYHLDEKGRYRAVTPREGKWESSVIPGFFLRAEWLWADPQPRYQDVLAELGTPL
ncbi:MAG TPA: Uma2 family endonuclease [Ardenticatenaceae bacterium]